MGGNPSYFLISFIWLVFLFQKKREKKKILCCDCC